MSTQTVGSLPLTFDRRPSAVLVDALRQGGPIASVTELVKTHRLWDIGFRSVGGRPAAFVYRGRTVVLRILTAEGGGLRLRIDVDKYRDAGFDPSWEIPQPAESFQDCSAAIVEYLRAVASRVHTSFISGEALIQAAILHGSSGGAAAIDREAVPGWTGTRSERDLRLLPIRARYDELAGRRCGKEADALALSLDGTRLFVIECKPKKHHLNEAVAQASWYAALFRAWLAADLKRAAGQLEVLSAARAAIGLCSAIPLVEPTEVRAVVALELDGDATVMLDKVANLAGSLAGAPLHDNRAPLVALVGEEGMEMVST